MMIWRENIERVREALNTAHPISGDDHDAVDASDAALTALTAQIEELQEDLVVLADHWKIRVEELEAALQVLYDWSSRMPDAGFTAVSPRYLWWFERPVAQVRAALAQSDPPED